MIFTGLFFIVFTRHDGVSMDEQRTLAQFPAFPKKISSKNIKRYFASIDKFIIDFFPGRSRIINDFNKVSLLLVGQGGGDLSKAFRGKDGWLFLGDIYNQALSKLTGQEDNSPKRIKGIADTFISLNAVLLNGGVKTAFVVGVNKGQIYPDKLPDFIRPSKQRYSAPVLEALRKGGIKVIDPIEILQKGRHEHTLYYLTDTHWNLSAGALVYQLIAQKLGFVPVQFKLKPVPSYPGDLVKIGMFQYNPPTVTDNYQIVWQEKSSVEFSKNGEDFSPVTEASFIAPYGQFFRNPNAPIKKDILIIGDSFSVALQPYLAETFRMVYLIHSDAVTPEELAKMLDKKGFKPDYALFIIVERKL